MKLEGLAQNIPELPQEETAAAGGTFSYTSPYSLFPTGHLMVSPWLVTPPHHSEAFQPNISLVDRNRCPTYGLKALFQGLGATCFPPSVTE